ncbi:MAG: alpha/beta fold hydrolase [Lysobacterales bacterium]|jgi:pimeloyl-ACP methyl ester carboxylesterase/DNA-binding CsgD family transcriptional regulator
MAELTQDIRFCTTHDGKRIAYATLGSGPPLVKTANWLTHLEHDLVSPVWRPWLERLGRSHTVIRYDERGCGLSDRDVPDADFDDWVADLESVVNATGLDRFALLGLSQGGAVAIAYAALYPDRVTHLVLYGAYARGRVNRDSTPSEREEAALLHKLIEIGWGKENPAFRQVFTSFFIPEGGPEHYQWFNDLQRLSATPEMASRILSICDGVDVRALASRVHVPTLVLHAREDARIPFEEGRLLAGLIPGAHFVPLDSRNHAILHTEPAWEQLQEVIGEFLGSEPAPPPTSGTATWLEEMTPREREVLEWVAGGHNNRTIADHLHLSEKTIRNYVTRLFDKLGVNDRPQAIVRAREAGFGRRSTN